MTCAGKVWVCERGRTADLLYLHTRYNLSSSTLKGASPFWARFPTAGWRSPRRRRPQRRRRWPRPRSTISATPCANTPKSTRGAAAVRASAGPLEMGLLRVVKPPPARTRMGRGTHPHCPLHVMVVTVSTLPTRRGVSMPPPGKWWRGADVTWGKGADLTPPQITSLASPHRPKACDGSLEP